MKITYLTDIHGDQENVHNALMYSNHIEADVFAIGGDIVDTVFFDEGIQQAWFEMSNTFRGYCEANKKNPPEMLEALLHGSESNREFAKDYIALIQHADENMAEQYENLSRILEKSKGKVLLVPGNYDGYTLDKFLEQYNIHEADKEKGKLIVDDNEYWFAGYGSAEVTPLKIPWELIVDYNAQAAAEHFERTEPDIIISHTPPMYLGDVVNAEDNREEGQHEDMHVGNPFLTQYLNDVQPDLVLTGHVHEQCGIYRLGRTSVLNPGSLSRSEAGTFAVIDVNPLEAEKYEILKITDPKQGRIARIHKDTF